MSEDIDPRTATASKEKLGDWVKLGHIHRRHPLNWSCLGGCRDRKELQAQLLHQPAHPGRRSQICEDRNA